MAISDDEYRLIRLFRALAFEVDRHELLRLLTARLLEELLPDQGVYGLMPCAAGIEPTGSIYENWTIAHVLHCALEEAGEETLFGSSHWDEEGAIPRFAYGADKAATEQGIFFNYREEFAREYLTAWRWEIVRAIESQRKKNAPKDALITLLRRYDGQDGFRNAWMSESKFIDEAERIENLPELVRLAIDIYRSDCKANPGEDERRKYIADYADAVVKAARDAVSAPPTR